MTNLYKAHICLFPVGHGGRKSDYMANEVRMGIKFPEHLDSQYSAVVSVSGDKTLKLGIIIKAKLQFANAVQSGAIDLAQNATITLFACDSDRLAEVLSSNLGYVGRTDVTVIGAQGNVAPIISNGREIGAITGQPYQKFRSYKNGKVISSTRRIKW